MRYKVYMDVIDGSITHKSEHIFMEIISDCRQEVIDLIGIALSKDVSACSIRIVKSSYKIYKLGKTQQIGT